MRPGVRISIVAMGLLMATGGLLQPIRSSVESSRAEVERLQQELARSGDLPRERRRLQQELDSILQEIQQHGARTFQAADLEGYRWTFAQAAPRM